MLLLTLRQEFGNTNQRSIRKYVVPNTYTLVRVPDTSTWAPEDITDYTGRGTAVASVAAGLSLGVASNANLVIVKYKNAALVDSTYKIQSPHIASPLIAWDWIINDVADQRRRGNNGKFIINFSQGGFSIPFSKSRR